MNICVEGPGLAVISGESLLGVGDIKSSINSSFQGSEHLSSSGGPGKTNIQTSSECSWTIIVVLHTVHVSINVGVSLVHRVKAELLENPPGEQKPSAVSSSIVGETNLHTVPGQLVAVGGADDNVTLEPGVGNLAADIGVGEAHDHPVLGGVVLVLVLNYKTLASEVVGLSLAPPAELDLEPLEVGFAFHHLYERHFDLLDFSCRSESSNISLVACERSSRSF